MFQKASVIKTFTLAAASLLCSADNNAKAEELKSPQQGDQGSIVQANDANRQDLHRSSGIPDWGPSQKTVIGAVALVAGLWSMAFLSKLLPNPTKKLPGLKQKTYSKKKTTPLGRTLGKTKLGLIAGEHTSGVNQLKKALKESSENLVPVLLTTESKQLEYFSNSVQEELGKENTHELTFKLHLPSSIKDLVHGDPSIDWSLSNAKDSSFVAQNALENWLTTKLEAVIKRMKDPALEAAAVVVAVVQVTNEHLFSHDALVKAWEKVLEKHTDANQGNGKKVLILQREPKEFQLTETQASGHLVKLDTFSSSHQVDDFIQAVVEKIETTSHPLVKTPLSNAEIHALSNVCWNRTPADVLKLLANIEGTAHNRTDIAIRRMLHDESLAYRTIKNTHPLIDGKLVSSEHDREARENYVAAAKLIASALGGDTSYIAQSYFEAPGRLCFSNHDASTFVAAESQVLAMAAGESLNKHLSHHSSKPGFNSTTAISEALELLLKNRGDNLVPIDVARKNALSVLDRLAKELNQLFDSGSLSQEIFSSFRELLVESKIGPTQAAQLTTHPDSNFPQATTEHGEPGSYTFDGKITWHGLIEGLQKYEKQLTLAITDLNYDEQNWQEPAFAALAVKAI